MSDRREHPRVPVAKPAVVEFAGSSGKFRMGLFDVGLGGLRCSGPAPAVSEASRATITLDTGAFFSAPLALPALVKRVAPLAGDEVRELAFEFEPVGQRALKRLTSYLKRAAGAHEKLSNAAGSASAIAEAFRMLRVSIGPVPESGPRLVLVTSSVPAEGKSFTATHLATVLAWEGHRVLVVDGDLRHPSVRPVAGVDTARGLAELLVDGTNTRLSDVAQPSRNGFSVLSAGNAVAEATEGWNHRAAKSLVERLRASDYEYVIIDSPPLLVAAWGSMIAPHVDDVLLVARSGGTLESDLLRSQALLNRCGASLSGIVLNDQPAHLQPVAASVYYQSLPPRGMRGIPGGLASGHVHVLETSTTDANRKA